MAFDPDTTLSHADRSVDPDPSLSDLSSSVPGGDGAPTASSDDGGGTAPRCALEETLATLDAGAGAVACSTGAAAVSTVAHLFDADDHVVCADAGPADPTQELARLDEQGRLSVSFTESLDRDALNDAIRPETAALWVQTPADPQLRVADLEALTGLADAHDLMLIVDNTALSPVLQRPIEHGADLVVYTEMATLSGHADVEGGAVVARTEPLAETLVATAAACGTAAAPETSALLLRGLKTLSVRTRQQETNARALAYDLADHPAVDRVRYPGRRDHPDHETARRQQDGYGAVLSFVVDADRVDEAAFLDALDVIRVADGAGGTASHLTRTPSSRASQDGWLRLSVGIEAPEDLQQDLARALEAAHPAAADAPQPASDPRGREPVPAGNAA